MSDFRLSKILTLDGAQEQRRKKSKIDENPIFKDFLVISEMQMSSFWIDHVTGRGIIT